MATADATDDKDIVLEVFQRFDMDGNGTLDSVEIFQALNILGVPTDSAEAEMMLKRFDVNSNGVLELAEFRELYSELRTSLDARKRPMEAEQWTAAKWLDATGVTSPLASAILGHKTPGDSVAELAEMRRLGSKAGSTELREILREILWISPGMSGDRCHRRRRQCWRRLCILYSKVGLR